MKTIIIAVLSIVATVATACASENFQPASIDYDNLTNYCTPDMPGYNHEWLETGETPCAWAGYSCDTDSDCDRCDKLVENCYI